MTFKNMDELRNYVLSHSEIAVKRAQEKVAMVINHFLTEYYKEFEPEFYVRTFQLLNSLVKADIKPTKNGWAAEVYFDINALDYSTRVVSSQFSWANGDNTYHRNKWTHDNDVWVLETAMNGNAPHGGYAKGTAIWKKSVETLIAEKRDILKQALIDAGIPVR